MMDETLELQRQINILSRRIEGLETLDVPIRIPWTDHSDDSTIVGWSSYTNKFISYKKSGKLVFVQYFFRGTSDTTTVTFTLPYSQGSGITLNVWARTKNDSGAWSDGFLSLGSTDDTCIGYATVAAGIWTASNEKGIIGEFWYESA